MKRNQLFMVLALCVSLWACKKDEKKQDEKKTETTQTEKKEGEKKEEKSVTLAPGTIPFDFPTVKTFAKEGEYVLCPGYKMWQNSISAADPTNETYIFYTAEMAKPGEVESEVKFTFDGNQMMPNSIIIPIPKGQKAKVGDIVLTWWQTGSGMQRAIVTDASTPTEPVVRYLDLGWDNPAQDSKSGKGIGQTEYKLKPDSFVFLGNFAPGSTIAAKDNGKWNAVQVIRMSDNREKVLTLGFAGKMKVYSGKDCQMIPQKVKVKAGDKVQAVFVGAFTDATVTKVDDKLGVVFVKFPNSDKETAVSFGYVVPTLPKI